MTYVNHALTGVAIMVILFKTSFIPLPLLILYGAVAGSLPDTLDWILHKINPARFPRWGKFYTWFHSTWTGHLVAALMVAPLPHILFDHLIHPPVLARKGENPYMDEILFLKLSRHDIIWLTGEFMLLILGVLLLCLS